MSDSCYDLAGTSTTALRRDLVHLRKVREGVPGGDPVSRRKANDITQDICEIEAELKARGETL